MTQEGLRTVHHHFHGVHKTINYFQGLGYGHTGLLLSESVQSPKHCLDLAFPQELLRECYCDTFTHVLFHMPRFTH